MADLNALLGTGPDSIDDVIKVSPSEQGLSPYKTQGRRHRKLLKDIIAALTAKDPDVPATPEGVDWVTKSKASLSAEGLTVSVTAGSADFGGTPVSYTATSFSVTLPAPGKLRQDLIAALADGTFQYKTGAEGKGVVTPDMPAMSLFVAYITFSSEGGAVQQPQPGQVITPKKLNDAATVTVNGSESINFVLENPTQLTTLAFSNTVPGGDYRVSINGCAGQTITIAPVAGVVYKPYGENAAPITTVKLLESGDCVVAYYHEADTLRRVVVLDGKGNSGGDFVPKTLIEETIINAGAFDFGHAHSVANDGDGNSIESLVRTFHGIPYEEITKTLPNGDTAYLKEDVYGEYAFPVKTYRITVAGVTYEARQMLSWSAGVFAAGWEIQVGTTTYSLKLHHDGKLYLNGVEFTGGGGGGTFTPIAANQYSTHPAFASQHELNVWLLQNAYTK
jgi:hypothetical protein